jgi:hypothetical protein
MVDNDFVIFSDPARPPSSKERSMGEILPDPRIVERKYRDAVSGMCFEIPPYMDLAKVDFEHEAEYVSIDGRLNRLNIYTGKLRSAERSAVILPESSAIRGIPRDIVGNDNPHGRDGKFLNEVDPSVVKAGLLGNLIHENSWRADPVKLDSRRTVLISDVPLLSPFIKDRFRILSRSSDSDLVRKLNEAGAGSVTLRYTIDPKSYWTERNRIQDRLTGKRKVHLFKDDIFIIAERI